MNTDHISQYVSELWDDSIVPTLQDYVRIPNKSPAFEPDWQRLGHMQAAVELLRTWVAASGVRGLTQRIVTLPGRTPVLLCEIAGNGAGNVLLYGHYDKQPEFEGWAEGLSPWQPVLRAGRLYGRGAADDGYACFASLAAIAALQDQGLPHPRCVVLIEGLRRERQLRSALLHGRIGGRHRHPGSGRLPRRGMWQLRSALAHHHRCAARSRPR